MKVLETVPARVLKGARHAGCVYIDNPELGQKNNAAAAGGRVGRICRS